MDASSTMTGSFAKSRPTQNGETFPQFGETNSRVINKFKDMFGDSAAVVLGRWLGISDKTAKRKLRGERPLTLEEYGKLVRDTRGFSFVEAVASDCGFEWWRICAALMDASDIRKMQMAAQRRIAKTLESALDADRSLASAIARADALAVHDEDHARPYGDALRSMARVSNRAVAPSKGRRR